MKYSFKTRTEVDINLTKVWRELPDKPGYHGWLSFLSELPEVEDAQFNTEERLTTLSFANAIDYSMFLLRWS